MSQENSALEIAERFFDAYNRADTEAMGSLLADDLSFGHHNRFRGTGKAKMLATFSHFADQIPGRRYNPVLRFSAGPDFIFCEHTWTGVPKEDSTEWGWKAGEEFTGEVLTVLGFRDGLITEWYDYG
ncbi:nuclear transport factor 2 family protein [Amycolatopsis sp. K13G38]|uniref:Nuclear transport factor 2 family protein n=1 Tax=Amycolatopsis acididurans TaxID=2724524 RepID=A0ABX1J3M7_9PSEU|nr:nuclear transport factor 2 family protein [Amycolatopsis acididurans]NKQ54402.1 nuclear transport factor 2 family protein [Amycolatopsis acididurans]